MTYARKEQKLSFTYENFQKKRLKTTDKMCIGNRVDSTTRSSFYFPHLIDNGDFKLGKIVSIRFLSIFKLNVCQFYIIIYCKVVNIIKYFGFYTKFEIRFLLT